MPVPEDFAKGLGGSLPFQLSPADHAQENPTARCAMLLTFPHLLASSPSPSSQARTVPPPPWKRRAGPEICVSKELDQGEQSICTPPPRSSEFSPLRSVLTQGGAEETEKGQETQAHTSFLFGLLLASQEKAIQTRIGLTLELRKQRITV